MASLYKKLQNYKDKKTGETRQRRSKKWWGKYRDELDQVRRVSLATDKAAAQVMLDELIRKADRRRAGIVDPFEAHEDRPLSQHLDEFSAVLTSKGLTADYVNTTKQRIRVIIEGCGFQRIGDISASKVQLQLAALRSNGKSIASMNHYLRAIKMFTRWSVRDRRTS
jgi:hypothetical protein